MRALLLILFFVCFRGLLFAQTSAEELRALAYQGDYEAIEMALAAAHQKTLRREISFDDLRDMVESLTVTHPVILETTTAWLEAKPNSPYANALRAFQYRHYGWAIRGEAPGRETDRWAHETFNRHMHASMHHALIAYDAAPDYAPAIDAVFRQQVHTRQLNRREFLDSVAHAMATVPSIGTLSRAARSAHIGWGGRGMEDIIFFCEEYVAQVEDVQDYTREICIADQTYRIWTVGEAQRQWAWEQLGNQYHWRLDQAVLRRVTWPPFADRPDGNTDRLISYFENEGRSDHESVASILLIWHPDRELAVAMKAASERGWDQLVHGIEHDPFNRKLLDALMGSGREFADFVEDPARVSLDPTRALNQRSRYIALLRFVFLEPHNQRSWATAAEQRAKLDDSNSEAEADALFNTAIYYSDHNPATIAWALSNKWARFAKATGYEAGMPIGAEHADSWLCPMIRLERLFHIRCVDDPNTGLSCQERLRIPPGQYELALQDARENDMCQAQSSGTFDKLAFTEPSYAFTQEELLTPLQFKTSWQDP